MHSLTFVPRSMSMHLTLVGSGIQRRYQIPSSGNLLSVSPRKDICKNGSNNQPIPCTSKEVEVGLAGRLVRRLLEAIHKHLKIFVLRRRLGWGY
jgi:hypothetical protein